MTATTSLPCPLCRTPIAIDPVSLLAGEKADCAGCGSALRLEPGETMRSTIERFDAARAEVKQVIGGRARKTGRKG
ncbi:hypothetical protein WAB17_10345 [Parerythrobacter aurantius]|uniref:hypothetical protein n=1 Tax=Parerythrobacter aurantius TaxID=3127706 RepID=UPI003245D650